MSNPQAASSHIENDALFEVLSNQRRRLILETLSKHRSELSVDSLVERVVDAELNGHVNRDELRSQVEVSFHHVHLPKLEQAGLIDHDPSMDRVANTEAITRVEPHLELVRQGN